MNTPICDFVRSYVKSHPLRLHMPGHKGTPILGAEAEDITEIAGADSLYEATGIIAQSEKNAGWLFGADTFYSTEGSSLCIRAMLYLAVKHAQSLGKKPRIVATRNVHKTFLSAAALLDFETVWLYPKASDSYLSCIVDMEELESVLCQEDAPTAVYLTSPDYLGKTVDVAAIAELCHSHGVLLLVDNAHGAYLKFLPESRHPMDLGADLCCDSAHKTLPVLTGGAYLHLAKHTPAYLKQQAKAALALFGSTSPSYLILQSLDAANPYLAEVYSDRLADFLCHLQRAKEHLQAHGYTFYGNEPLKLTLCAKEYGYTGEELALRLAEKHIICEFSDPDFIVLMLTPELGEDGLDKLITVLCAIEKRPPLADMPPVFAPNERVCSVREAVFCESECLPVSACVGRVLAEPSVGCPPAVPIVLCGERITDADAERFAYYNITHCTVVKE